MIGEIDPVVRIKLRHWEGAAGTEMEARCAGCGARWPCDAERLLRLLSPDAATSIVGELVCCEREQPCEACTAQGAMLRMVMARELRKGYQ